MSQLAGQCFGVLVRVEGKKEGRAFAGGALGPYAAIVALDDPLHAGEADARAGELTFSVQPLEWLEQLIGVCGVEAGTVVANIAAGGDVLLAAYILRQL